MLEISVDPKVAQAFKAAFPKPPNGSKRALDKYVATLTTMLTGARQGSCRLIHAANC